MRFVKKMHPSSVQIIIELVKIYIYMTQGVIIESFTDF